MDTGMFHGSEDALRTCGEYADMVYRLAAWYTADPAKAEEIFSRTFLTCFCRNMQFESEEQRRVWLLGTAVRCAREICRGQKSGAGAAPGAGTALQDALARLGPETREAACLYYLQELPVRTAAQVLGRDEHAVQTQLDGAREQLKSFLADPGQGA